MLNAQRLSGGRLHLSDGPIDLVILAEGDADAVERVYEAATERLEGLLAELVAELPRLRCPLGDRLPPLRGAVARRMAEAAFPFRDVFVTPMAAVAGAVAEVVLAAMLARAPLRRAYVNDGGDIALHLQEGAHLDIGVVRELSVARPEAYVRIATSDPVRGALCPVCEQAHQQLKAKVVLGRVLQRRIPVHAAPFGRHVEHGP